MFEDIPTLEDLGGVQGRSVLVRADLNVPLRRQDGPGMVIADDYRILASLPTLRWLIDRGAKVTVASHVGRPHGRVVPDLVIEPVRRRLAELVPGLTVLENLRFDPGEEAGDPAFGARLTEGHDAYVNDAFGACHRAHASIVYPPTVLPSAGGLLVQRELQALATVLESPPRPFTAVLGGAKVADKIGTVGALAKRADQLLVGGALAFTFMVAQGREVGESPVDADAVDACAALLRSEASIHLPEDFLIVPFEGPTPVSADAEVRVVTGEIPSGWQAFDIGPHTRQMYAQQISASGAVLWNGPLGLFEDPRFAEGTKSIATAVARCRGYSIAGGGDTVAAVRSLGLSSGVDHLSSGGGAMLELLEHGDLPGIAALRTGMGVPIAPARRRKPEAPAAAREMLEQVDLPQPVRVGIGSTLREVAATMTDQHVSYVVVGSHPWWLVTEHDLAGALAAGLEADSPIEQIANRTPLWITTSGTVGDAVGMMLRHRVRELLVITPRGELAGVLPLGQASRNLLGEVAVPVATEGRR